MAKFQFRLASVQRLRESVRDERRAKLAEAYAALRQLDERRSEIEHERDQLLAWQTSSARGQVNVDHILEAQRYQAILQSELHVLSQQRQAVETEAEKRRAALVLADQEVKVLEKLCDSQLERHRQHAAALDMKQLDEVAARTVGYEESA